MTMDGNCNAKRFLLIALKIATQKSSKKIVQDAVNDICREEKIPPIRLKFTDRALSKGSAYYSTTKVGDKNKPVSITVGEWGAMKTDAQEVAYVVGHELAHHVMNVRNNSLRHNQKFKSMSDKFENKLLRKIGDKLGGLKKNKPNVAELKRLRKKLKYWQEHKKELIEEHKKYDVDIDYDYEIGVLKRKIKELR